MRSAAALQCAGKLPTLKKKLSNQNVGLRGADMRLRSIELEMPDRNAAVRFLKETWGLLDGGSGYFLEGPEGHVFRFVIERKRVKKLRPDRDRPLQVTHVVLNARDREACTRFAVDVLGFRLSDRTGFMNFVRCDRVHHAVAYAQSDNSLLNHIAFEMTDIDAVMRGIGRLKDAGVETFWGPGRHGPGNNVFAYFVAPFGAAIEYTSEVQRIGHSYKVGTPEDWKWPPGRNDHWGISTRNSAAISQAERRFGFRPLVAA